MIAITVKRPELAIPLAFVSHFVQDAIPHWDYGTSRPGGRLLSKKFNRLLAADFLLALIAMAFFAGVFPELMWIIWISMFAAAAPDLMWAYYYIYINKIKKRKIEFNWLARFHSGIEWSETPKGLIVEVVWFFMVGFIILKLR